MNYLDTCNLHFFLDCQVRSNQFLFLFNKEKYGKYWVGVASSLNFYGYTYLGRYMSSFEGSAYGFRLATCLWLNKLSHCSMLFLINWSLKPVVSNHQYGTFFVDDSTTIYLPCLLNFLSYHNFCLIYTSCLTTLSISIACSL